MSRRSPVSTRRLTWGATFLGVLVFGLRAALTSLSFMLPGGSILGWSSTPARHCLLCSSSSTNNLAVTNHNLTPQEYAVLLASQLPLDAKLGQLVMVQFQGTEASPDVVQMISSQDVGGVIFYAGNIASAQQVRALTGQLQQMAPIPLLTSIDQEGGTVNRLISILGPLPGAAQLANPAQAELRGEQDAKYLHDFGFNLNLAPVVDVGTANAQLWDRTFGSNQDRVAVMAGAYLRGLQQTGEVVGTLKHFPGLGSTTTDPHVGLPILSRSRTDWERIDLEPYRVLLAEQHVSAIMVTHILVPAVDPNLPASLSPTLITGVLRQQLGFNGVVITDDLTMGALSSRWTLPEAAVLAIKAGTDVVTGAANSAMVEEVTGALKQALAQGILSEARIDQAVEHVLELKLQLHLISMPASMQHVGRSNVRPDGLSQVDCPAVSPELSSWPQSACEAQRLQKLFTLDQENARSDAPASTGVPGSPRAPPPQQA